MALTLEYAGQDKSRRCVRPRLVDPVQVICWVIAAGVIQFFCLLHSGAFEQSQCTRENYAKAAIGPNGPIRSAIRIYRFDTGVWPQTLNDLMVAPANTTTARKWRGPYLQYPDDIADRWGEPYRYTPPVNTPAGPMALKLWSLGPDGLADTADDIGVK